MAVLPISNDFDDVARATPQFFAFLASVAKWHGKICQWILRTAKILEVSCILSVISRCLGLGVVSGNGHTLEERPGGS